MIGKSAIIIGSGFGALGSACLLAKAGWNVTVLEKNNQIGGRAGYFEEEGFRFDMGPSWYLMPDVFEHFFKLLGEDVNKHLKLKKLSPSYRIFYKDTFLKIDIHSDLEKDLKTIEQIETGAGSALESYLDQAGYQYGVAKDRFMYKNYDSFKDFFTREMATEGRKLNVLSNMNKHVGKYFKTDAMQKLMQYPLVFLGSSPYNTPAIYNIMSHIDFNMGVYYPDGGIYEIVKALQKIAEKHGAKFVTDCLVEKIIVEDGKAVGVMTKNGEQRADIVISNADIHHTETQLLETEYRTKTERYWHKRTMAPSALIMYLGVKGKIPELTHHNLLFSKDWKKNFAEIFDQPRWPKDPSLYICNPSKTDPSVAPKDHENLFVLVPVASGLKYDDELLEHYSNKILETIEKHMYVKDLRERIVYKKLFSVRDFEQRYNSYKGSALGLAHTLRQTAIFRPNNISKKVKDLYYVGAGTNPGIGMPITLISAELMYKRLINDKSSGPLKPEQL
ncbi:phytoene desaturase [Candidatus Saccharibacteria bacterium]|nr:phytoene desaturase [Candidatus Saccharibacteria bacterium]